jgi:hypothetical protein
MQDVHKCMAVLQEAEGRCVLDIRILFFSFVRLMAPYPRADGTLQAV